jgi:SAM-dependent methyltransferase
MTSKAEFIEGTLQQIRASEKENGPYEVKVAGRRYTVLPGVFSPKYFKDTEFFAESIPYEPGGHFFEVGCGTGIISVHARLEGMDSVRATDVNSEAIRNIAANVQRHCVERVDSRVGDVYGDFEADQNEDVIFWNVPFGFADLPTGSMLERSVIDPGYGGIARYVHGLPYFLHPEGRAFLGFSNDIGRFDLLEGIAHQAGFDIDLIAQRERDDHNPEGPVTFELYELVRE